MSNTFSLLLPFCGLFPSLPQNRGLIAAFPHSGLALVEIWPIIRLRENSYTRVHFNLTRRILSARIQDPATAPAAVRIPRPGPRPAGSSTRPAGNASRPGQPRPAGVAPARHAGRTVRWPGRRQNRRRTTPRRRAQPAAPAGRRGPPHQGQEAFQQIGPQGRKLRKRN